MTRRYSHKVIAVQHFGIMGKYWQPGKVKTRLAQRLGAAAASQLYRTFLSSLLTRFASVADHRSLVFTPLDAESAFRDLASEQWDLTPQSEGTLGARIESFFDLAFASGAQHVVLIGSDSPSLPAAYLDTAFQQLQHYSIVLGPSTDGGFYLIGATEQLPHVMQGIPWSTADVLRCTEERLQQAGSTCCRLPSWYDIDEYQHLLQLDRELQNRTGQNDALNELTLAVRLAVTRSRANKERGDSGGTPPMAD